MDVLKLAIALLAWFSLISIGVTVPSREIELSGVVPLVWYALSNTATNVGLLAIVASIITAENVSKGIVRGFVCYAAAISGAVVFFTDAVAEPTVSQYMKIAGTMSLVAMVVNYRPELFDRIIARVSGDMGAGARDAGN